MIEVKNQAAKRDRNLLFGVIAIELKFANPQELAIAACTWAGEDGLELGDVLVSMNSISSKNRELIDSLIDAQIEAHGGDVSSTLHTFGGARAVHESFSASIIVTEEGVAPSLQSFGGESATSGSGGPTSLDRLDDDEKITVAHPGRYSIKGEYRRGGIGRVMIAFDEHMGREVAMKQLLEDSGRGQTSSDPSPRRVTGQAGARFLREARITGQLEHPGIVPVYEIVRKPDGEIFYTMKLVRGKTLGEKLDEANGLDERLTLMHHFIDLCHAVAYAHSKGVIHRDLKPANVMVGEFGETVLLDWGLAKIRGLRDLEGEELEKGVALIKEASVMDTVSGQAIGTPAYMSPEQAEGRIPDIDERSDVWSLGAVLYEILTGHPPFTGDFAYEVIGKVIKDPVVAVNELEPHAPLELALICEKCLSKECGQRYENAKVVAHEITEAQRAMVQKREMEAKANLAESYLLLSRWAKSTKAWSRAEVYCAKSLTVFDSVNARVFLNSIQTEPEATKSELLSLRGHANEITCGAFSPDGKILASGGKDRTIKVWPFIPRVMESDPQELLDEIEKKTNLKVVGMDIHTWNPSNNMVADIPLPRPF